ncbi:MAG TPA: CpaD family pilus assembly lipoprotein [Aliidongia sp.]|uniref:CpaD family pilus assembly lipoprotein n=1 Tax=Aliidongia sp. TaxID=1914230 RepID=UPI002DDD0C87|nr:CpaD family pilus assembly lipoprotein [Aliidongia sp.]HEV2676367.1 CpaD family pilus assembly lipoprotein [Aliidongia sp.]
MKRVAASLLPLLMVAGLGACSRTSDEVPVLAHPETHLTQIEKQEQQFLVPVGRGTTELSPASRHGFDRFIAEAAAGNPQILHVTLWGGAPQVVATLRQAAIADGVNPAKIEIQPVAAAAPGPVAAVGQVKVIATTYRAVMPSCARRSVDAIANSQNPAWSDFGCTVNSSLAAMVEDPRDLIQGQTGGETDSAISGAAIDRLLQDKTRKFDAQTFTPGQSGGSAP